MHTIPACYFPTKIVFVDDNHNFLSCIKKKFDSYDYSFEFHKDANLALSHINDTSIERQIGGYFHQVLESDLCDSKVVEYKMRDICDLIYNKKRFDIHSVVFVDYDMPSMDGLEFCSRITNQNIQKILLTGVADELVAIEAFNKGHIHGYIKKQNADLFGKIESFINKFTIKYFNELTYKREVEVVGEGYTATNIAQFKEIFNNIVKNNNIVEFYQFDPIGSFLMIDASGSIKTLYVSNEAKNNKLLNDINLYFDEEFTLFAKDQILKDNKVFCYDFDRVFIHDKDPGLIDEIEKQFCSSKVINGEVSFYYALEDGMYPIDYDLVYSFKASKKNLNLQAV